MIMQLFFKNKWLLLQKRKWKKFNFVHSGLSHRQKIYRKKKKGEEEKTPCWNSKGSYSLNLSLIEEAPGHEPSGLRIKNI
jgi:hypothetical protein